MRTTLNIDDELLAEAQRFEFDRKPTNLIRAGFRFNFDRWLRNRE